jgi:hypothetical protein
MSNGVPPDNPADEGTLFGPDTSSVFIALLAFKTSLLQAIRHAAAGH